MQSLRMQRCSKHPTLHTLLLSLPESHRSKAVEQHRPTHPHQMPPEDRQKRLTMM